MVALCVISLVIVILFIKDGVEDTDEYSPVEEKQIEEAL